MNPSTLLLYGGSHLTIVGQDMVWFTRYDPTTGDAFFDPRLPSDVQIVGEESLRNATGPVAAADTIRDGMDFLFIGQAWTLGVELLFYIIAPFVVRRLGPIAVLFCASVATRVVLAKIGYSGSPWTYRFFPSELAFFLMGSASYHFYNWAERTNAERLRKLGYVALPALVCVILFLFKLEIPLRALIVISATAVCLPAIFALTKRNAADRWIGELSYPIYISHELIRLALIHYAGTAPSGALTAASIVAGIALLVLIEQPFDRLRARFIARRVDRQRPAEADATGSQPRPALPHEATVA